MAKEIKVKISIPKTMKDFVSSNIKAGSITIRKSQKK